jgi:hypothetical protein
MRTALMLLPPAGNGAAALIESRDLCLFLVPRLSGGAARGGVNRFTRSDYI